MEIVDKLIDELTDKNIPLTDILIKTKVLAQKLKNEELKTWIDSELNGYNDGTLPEYRILGCQIIGTISNGFQRANNYPIPLVGFDKKLRKGLKTVKLYQSISTLDQFVRNEKGGKLYMNIPPEMYGYLSKDFDGGFVIEYAKREIDKTQVIQTLTAVRTKLLDFLLKLNDELGEGKDITTLTEGKTKQKVDSLFHSTVFGDNTTIIVGDNNTQTVTNIKQGNFDSLEKHLLNNGLEKEDINELRKYIDNDNPNADNKEFGGKVKGWVSKMLTKAMDGTWQIGLGAAGNLLADSIGTYYGWK